MEVASITAVPKTATPQQHADLRHISITAVLYRMLELVREFIYPAILQPPDQLSCTDQYASVQLDPRPLPLSPFSSLLRNCSHATRMWWSSRWISVRPLTLFDIPPCCTRWLPYPTTSIIGSSTSFLATAIVQRSAVPRPGSLTSQPA